MTIIADYNGCLINMAQSGRFFGIAHGANCQNTMKSGIAPKLCNEWPQMREADLRTKRGSRAKLGTYSHSHCDKFELHLFNLYTQFTWMGRRAGIRDLDYKAVADVFKRLNYSYGYECRIQDKPLGIPMIGCGLAGGDWEAVRTIIDLATPDLNIEVVFLH